MSTYNIYKCLTSDSKAVGIFILVVNIKLVVYAVNINHTLCYCNLIYLIYLFIFISEILVATCLM